MEEKEKNIKDYIIVKLISEANNIKKISENSLKNNSKNYSQKILFNQKQFKLKPNNAISSLKIKISDIENVSSERIHIFFIDSIQKDIKEEKKENINLLILKKITVEYLLKNKKYLEESKDTDLIENLKIRLGIDYYPNLFYLIHDSNSIQIIDRYNPNYSTCVIIDFYQENIEKIIFNLDANCSLFLLKNIVSNKLNINMNINHIKLFLIDIIEINKENNSSIIIKNKEKGFSDYKNLNDIVEFFYPFGNNDRNDVKYNIHFLLTISNNVGNCEQMGLNFKFNYLKEISKISFDENAPEFCECSDGINLFFFCFNRDCFLFNKYFVINLGYGSFDIINQSKKVKCPKCFKNSNLELKNIGIINSKYYYKGILKNQEKKKAITEGNNMTLDEKLYIFKETKINSLLSQLYMQAKPHFIESGKVHCSKRTKEDEELDNIYLSDSINNHKSKFLSRNSFIGLNNNSNYKSLKGLNSDKNIINKKIKIYDNESDLIEKNDIIIDDFDSGILNEFNCMKSINFFNCFICEHNQNNNESFSESEYINNNNKSSVCIIF